MPAYDFRCAVCETEEERVVKLVDYDKPQTCEVCGEAMTRLPPKTSAFMLKGTGWYGTDYSGKKVH